MFNPTFSWGPDWSTVTIVVNKTATIKQAKAPRLHIYRRLPHILFEHPADISDRRETLTPAMMSTRALSFLVACILYCTQNEADAFLCSPSVKNGRQVLGKSTAATAASRRQIRPRNGPTSIGMTSTAPPQPERSSISGQDFDKWVACNFSPGSERVSEGASAWHRPSVPWEIDTLLNTYNSIYRAGAFSTENVISY